MYPLSMMFGLVSLKQWVIIRTVLTTFLLLVLNKPTFSEDFKGKFKSRYALVVTLAGNKKLADYFEWSCRTIDASKELFDMLVFHENNQRLKNMSCAENVKFFNLGEKGLSEIITKNILSQGGLSPVNEDTSKELMQVTNNVLLHVPQYLTEIKHMTGSLFKDYLEPYKYWSYTDPDIIWGNLPDWINTEEVEEYDLYSITINGDASRLFLRNQFTLHKNIDKINNLWRQLEFFAQSQFAARLGNAYRMILEHAPSDVVFKKNFHSPEGWYSELVFREGSKLAVKLVGRSFDDFFREPVILVGGHLMRCQHVKNLTSCIQHTKLAVDLPKATSLPKEMLQEVDTHFDMEHCRMAWLPTDTRHCIAKESFNKKDVSPDQEEEKELRLTKSGESVFKNGKWFINNESEAPRQIRTTAAFFHFRHWENYIALKNEVVWSPFPASHTEHCMMILLRIGKTIAFEDCDHVIASEKIGQALVLDEIWVSENSHIDKVADVLLSHRREKELGKSKSSKKGRNKGAGVKGKPKGKKSPPQGKHSKTPPELRAKFEIK